MHSGTRFLRGRLIEFLRPSRFLILHKIPRTGENWDDTVFEMKENGQTLALCDTIEEIIEAVHREHAESFNIVLFSHFGQPQGGFIRTPDIIRLLGEFPACSSTRDPMLSMISKYVRDPVGNATYIVNGYGTLQTLHRHYGLYCLPVDIGLDASTGKRREMAASLAAHLQLEFPSRKVSELARNWPIVGSIWNSSNPKERERAAPRIHMKELYEQRKLDSLIPLMPEYDLLKSREPVLRPFLYGLGYRDLIWWENDGPDGKTTNSTD